MRTQIERFTEKVQVNTGCWIWTGCILKNGYGQGRWDGKNEYAHRISYQIYKGQIPKGLVLDHLCRNKSCVNPDHLEAVTYRTNTLRGWGRWGNYEGKCHAGHALEGDNLYVYYRGRHKSLNCRTCRREAVYRNYHKTK